jgi:hypothetical protein
MTCSNIRIVPKSLRIFKRFKRFNRIKGINKHEYEKPPKTTTLNDLPNEVMIKIFNEALKNSNTAYCIWNCEYVFFRKIFVRQLINKYLFIY